MSPSRVAALALSFVPSLVACAPAAPPTSPDGGLPDEALVTPTRYAFTSRFVDGESSVAYSGQAGRMLLRRELAARIERTDDAALAGKTAEQLRAGFEFLFDFKTENGGTPEEPLTVDAFGTPLLQQAVGEVGVASLRSKLRDLDLADPTPVVGWRAGDRPASGVADDMLDDLVATLIARQTAAPTTPSGAPLATTFVGVNGVDHRALFDSYLRGAVALSQATDDYLDDETPAKGLLSDNVVAVDGKPYTELEHAWDEAFGYFGAARAYGEHTAAANAAGVIDVDADGRADWLFEVSYGDARDAAERDDDSASGTRFGQEAFAAFVLGRQRITSAAGPLDAAALDELKELRAVAEAQWERAVAATLVAALNDLVGVLSVDEAGYDFVAHARLWSGVKGTLLALQFNPRSPWQGHADDYAAAHALLGDAPVLERARFGDVIGDLQALRLLVQRTYDFDDADVAAW